MRHVVSALVALVMVSLVGQVAHAGFPERGIKIVVPFPAGGSNDVVARLLGTKLQELWGQPVVIDNRAGGGGNIGADAVVRSPADGYTLLLTAPGPLAVNQSLYAQLPFNPAQDFTPVALIASVPIVLAVNPGVKATTVAELIALAKASPGKLNFGSSGLGSTNHLAGELLKARAGIDIVHVPYRGAAPAMNDLIAGQIPMMFDNMPAIRPQVQGGTIRAIAVAGAARSPLFPELPTMAEAGVANFEASSWFGLVAPAKMPPDVTKVLIDGVTKVLKDPDMVKRLADVGAEPGTLSGDAFAAFLRTESDKWGQVVKTAGAKVE
ncbi:tripartite tricarboxylate transporter substrate binding protein [Tardiphaga sp. 37S4]|jgi:tripartite-type tricarboxylate transporter receptor subunit TctC|uniref:Bug family tripartite tricarboxylate transporter substrate binding protein n=1 Tax=Tardiphaga sp. 37S4 TaxID=1404741 RepID=UPI001E4ED50E|nr:tripartite tricarboxylate transporter substrate binding protein [Tardiphaga sp. 37S4]UFS78531.1 tripartite tricarboxylate transporter substrate binding protein [Tardiphaga sp. 37S4]